MAYPGPSGFDTLADATQATQGAEFDKRLSIEIRRQAFCIQRFTGDPIIDCRPVLALASLALRYSAPSDRS